MPRLIIGSTAMRKYLPDCREPQDVDVFDDWDPISKSEDVFWHPSLYEWLAPGETRTATLDELYTLKVSHSYWELRNGSWDKHMSDVVALKQAGAKLIPELHSLLYRIWEEKHGRKKVDLSLESEAFFADAVNRRYDHDSIHASVAYGERPAYEAVLKDGASVTVDMAKVRALSFDDQVKLFREEVYATALERKIVPSGYKASPRGAYAWALRRTITSLTKGWSARFLVENYDIFRTPDCDYVGRHLANADKLISLERN